jgi:hypothetical protein
MPKEADAYENLVGASYSSWIAPVATNLYGELNIINESFLIPMMVWGNGSIKPLSAFTLHGIAANPTRRMIILPGDWDPRTAGQCVNWVNYQTGWNLRGNANVWDEQYVNSYTYRDGAVIVLNLSKWGHVGITLRDNGDGTITYRSRNQDGLWVISDTTISKDDPRILGYIVPETN